MRGFHPQTSPWLRHWRKCMAKVKQGKMCIDVDLSKILKGQTQIWGKMWSKRISACAFPDFGKARSGAAPYSPKSTPMKMCPKKCRDSGENYDFWADYLVLCSCKSCLKYALHL